MKKLKVLLFWLVGFLLIAPLVVSANDLTDDEAAALGCMACGGGFITIIIVFFIINILILVWVARDAKARGMSPLGWLILVFFTGFIGLIIYLLARTAGEKVVCSKCNNKKLKAMEKCPHCGN